ncbi:hypothetical protein [Allokutzneria sp. NRRL B-24872]|uniref:hypothetical protein n=1 Tax=Allokutzneria sp. NRRL B-24872 TaxID=1137961 RepID=UPI000A37BB2F|nr:hypothetical protein [Allokutzneria sp. NRRL B-24872]
MSGWWKRTVERLTGGAKLPAGFTETLETEENVVAIADVRSGGHLIASSHGLWLPEDSGAHRRVGWHLISKAGWANGSLTVTEAEETGTAGEAVLLTDRAPRRYVLSESGKLPEAVHKRVTGSIRSTHRRDLPGGGAWFVQRKIPGRDGFVLQVRADPGTDMSLVEPIAVEVAEKLRQARSAEN